MSLVIQGRVHGRGSGGDVCKVRLPVLPGQREGGGEGGKKGKMKEGKKEIY